MLALLKFLFIHSYFPTSFVSISFFKKNRSSCSSTSSVFISAALGYLHLPWLLHEGPSILLMWSNGKCVCARVWSPHMHLLSILCNMENCLVSKPQWGFREKHVNQWFSNDSLQPFSGLSAPSVFDNHTRLEHLYKMTSHVWVCQTDKWGSLLSSSALQLSD